MKEVLYVISGKRLPVVFHVGARALTSQSLNIHAGHDDVMGVADCGWGILFARNVAGGGGPHRRSPDASRRQTETPFFVVQDGFLTTHTLENARLPEDELLREFVGDPRDHAHEPFDPADRDDERRRAEPGRVHEGPRSLSARYYDARARLDDAIATGHALTGRRYGTSTTHGLDDAEHDVVAMGTIADSALAVVDHLRSQGRRVGCLAVAAYRPFPADGAGRCPRGARGVAVDRAYRRAGRARTTR